MIKRGIAVHRINLSGGDRYDWPKGAVNFTGRFSDWAVFLDRFIREQEITDLLLFGDCRPYHVTAHGIAASRGVRIHVLEEGYLRPNWMTLERDGVNARSTLPRDKDWFVAQAQELPAEPGNPPVTASFRRRARDSYWYYHHVFTGRLRYPHYHSHRATPILKEGVGWLWRLATNKRRAAAAEKTLADLADKPFFLLPLQLSDDFQIKAHSSFPNMQSAAKYVVESFAANAPADLKLLIKAHPLDSSFFNWRRFFASQADRLGLTGRLYYVDGGDLDTMARLSKGMVCVNSTSATLALQHDRPVCAIGEAIYDIPGLTHQGHLDSFWSIPAPPEPGLYAAFRRVLVDRCLVRGGLASQSAVRTLIASMLERLGC
ncbi:capsule biosynthesis protein [Sphingomonas piscis]|nr:capsular biosynthesis protein [Sphingomonas piscis]